MSTGLAENAKRHWPDIAIVIILALLPVLFFWRLITPVPADRMNIAAGDFTEQYYPLRAYAAQRIGDAQLPLWNPSPYGGQPALADIQSGAVYPPQKLQGLLGQISGRGFPVKALELQVILHFSLAAVGGYFFGKRLASGAKGSHRTRRWTWAARRARLAGVVVSLVFTYSGYLSGFPVQQLTILEVSAWLPWVLLAVDGLSHQPTAGKLAWTGLALGLSFLPGHPQSSLYVVYAAVIFYLWRVFRQLPDSKGLRYGLTAAGWLAAALALGLGLAAVQLLPTAEFISRSPRADMSYEAVSFGLPLHELVALIYPGYFGGSPEYVGILTLVLIGLALMLGRPRPEVIFWAIVGVAALLLAFGGNTFLYSVFYLGAPGFDVVRHQERAFMLYAMSAAVLGGYGVQVLVSPLNRERLAKYCSFERGVRAVFWVGLALTFLFFFGAVSTPHSDLFGGVLRHHVFGLMLLAGSLVLLLLRRTRRLHRVWGMALIAVWIGFNLFSVNWRANLEQPPPGGVFAVTPLVANLRAELNNQPDPVRIASAGLLPGGPGAATVYGFYDTAGNTPLHLESLEAFEAAVPEWRRWQLMNVHYVLGDRPLESPGLQQIFPDPAQAELEEGTVRLYRMLDPLPRAWMVHGAEFIPDRDAALARVGSDDFDLQRWAVVDLEARAQLPGPVEGSWAELAAYAPERIELEVNAAADGVLVLSEMAYPGWQASVDGAAVEVLTVNGVMRGVPMPPGMHQVAVWYAPRSVSVGLLVTGLVLVVIALLLVASLVAGKGRAQPYSN